MGSPTADVPGCEAGRVRQVFESSSPHVAEQESASADSARTRIIEGSRVAAAAPPRGVRLGWSEFAGADSARFAALVTVIAVPVWVFVGLRLDSRVGADGQFVLGALTLVVFIALLRLHAPAVRFQALGVVAIATVGEVVGSLIWGLYTYRLDNIPAFVPPGHGLVYLTGFSLAALIGNRALSLTAIAVAASWGAAGVTILPRDVAGAIGCAFLIAVVLGARVPVYAGVFLVVAALELYGTAVGTWTWASTVPGLELSQGNPPSGVASGYVVFDILALALAARLRLVRVPSFAVRLRPQLRPRAEARSS